jgi:purine-cytosine permease-like protein
MLHSAYRSLLSKVIACFFMFVPILAFAEVSDKEPSIFYIWGVAAIATVVCFLGAHYRRWLALVLAVPPALWFASLLMEIHSADIGPYLYKEQGSAYYVQVYLALVLFMSGTLFAWLKNKSHTV